MPDTVSDDDPVLAHMLGQPPSRTDEACIDQDPLIAFIRAQRTGDTVHDAAIVSRLDTANLDHEFVDFGTIGGMRADEWIVLGVFGVILAAIGLAAWLASHVR